MDATAVRLRELMAMVIGLQISVVGSFFAQPALLLSGVFVTALASLGEISRWMGFR